VSWFEGDTVYGFRTSAGVAVQRLPHTVRVAEPEPVATESDARSAIFDDLGGGPEGAAGRPEQGAVEGGELLEQLLALRGFGGYPPRSLRG
jgi:hypothetical protein